MSSAATVWAWSVKCLPPQERLVLLALAESSDYAGLCSVNLKRLADLSDLRASSVLSSLESMESWGLIVRKKDNKDKNPSNRWIGFILLFDVVSF